MSSSNNSLISLTQRYSDAFIAELKELKHIDCNSAAHSFASDIENEDKARNLSNSRSFSPIGESEDSLDSSDDSQATLSTYVDSLDSVHKFHPYDSTKDIGRKRRFEQSYIIRKELGRGAFGSVLVVSANPGQDFLANQEQFKRPKGTLLEFSNLWLYESKQANRNNFALKSMTFDSIPGLRSARDVSKCGELEFIFNVPYHPNLIRVYEVFTMYDSALKNHVLNITMESMGSNLKGFLDLNKRNGQRSKPRMIKSILRQLLQALVHIHALGFVHRDVKPDNILITTTSEYYDRSVDGTTGNDMVNFDDYFVVKLADYGLSMNSYQDTTKYGVAGTLRYMAPELALNLYHDKRVDIWAFGCLALELIRGYSLIPRCKNGDELICHIIRNLGRPYPLSTNKYYSDEVQLPVVKPCFGYWTPVWNLLVESGIDADKAEPIMNIDYLDTHYFETEQDLKDIKGFADIIKRCLTWDPYSRASAHELLDMSFFQN
ncbi:hypothetical protein WICPIJ_007440 [Wickerhamomyces pijperi]|uniref:Protein kinase domain-containing protein n=1 Tax=Wickerhamomyces pijperi TaxID=599730 RepID=A0A9P8Q035_WICPI|nr:hypothetical protein WICPIJ_007440 [Wickerhamomyces pijperi]